MEFRDDSAGGARLVAICESDWERARVCVQTATETQQMCYNNRNM